MKATLSKDGKHRTNLRLDFRLDKEEMVNLLAIHAVTHGDVGEQLSEAKIMEMIKKQLTYQGLDVLEFGANIDPDDNAFEWAKEQIDRVWKEQRLY